MAKRIAVFGGSFNPAGLHHRAAAEILSRHFDEVAVVPCGPRPDKPTVGDIEPLHRAVMADLTFRGLPRVRVDLFDLEQNTFTRTHVLDEMYRKEGEVWHVVGADLVAGGGAGRSYIHRVWERGPEFWQRANFAVIERDGYPLDPADLPPRHQVIRSALSGSSSSVRERVFRHQPIGDLVTPEVAAYIERYGLYRGLTPPRAAGLRLGRPRALIVADERNPGAVALAAALRFVEDRADPNCIIVAGGDGTMIKAIRRLWRLRLPFIGVNAGHRGQLLNDLDRNGIPDLLEGDITAHQLPLLYAEARYADGRTCSGHAVNDAWVERASGQAAWIRVGVNGETRLPRLVADGALVATPAGSTAYARAMGAKPLLVGAREFLLVGSNVAEPAHWRSASLPWDAAVGLEAIDPDKRPIRAYVDGAEKGVVAGLAVRVSRVAAAEVAFAAERDIAAKQAEHFFSAA